MPSTNNLCDICVDGRVPRLNNVMNFLYMGPGSCMQYWIAGRRGQIPAHMCDVVKFLSRTTCGCMIDQPKASLQALALEMVGGVIEEGREPIKIPKGAAQLYSESVFAAFNKQALN